MENNLREVRPYGDTLNDGALQLSFTLPVPEGPRAREAAKRLLEQLGLQAVSIVHAADAGEGFTFIVAYARCPIAVDYRAIQVAEVNSQQLDFYQINEYIRRHIARKVIVVGACTGTDAHTVGLDAIMNMKGYAGEYGLERYPEIEAHNLGSQVPNEVLVARARELRADAILVSQVVTQKDVHIPNLTQLVELLEAEGMRQRVVLICGGPRISHELAIELGYDAGFGPGTLPPHVASFIAQEMVRRKLR
ncbi:MAG: cobalamin B12-binding domain-containing protein [Bacillota bacterium]|jgi:beta-lysine 5,6-aminomutase beta subunit